MILRISKCCKLLPPTNIMILDSVSGDYNRVRLSYNWLEICSLIETLAERDMLHTSTHWRGVKTRRMEVKPIHQPEAIPHTPSPPDRRHENMRGAENVCTLFKEYYLNDISLA